MLILMFHVQSEKREREQYMNTWIDMNIINKSRLVGR